MWKKYTYKWLFKWSWDRFSKHDIMKEIEMQEWYICLYKTFYKVKKHFIEKLYI